MSDNDLPENAIEMAEKLAAEAPKKVLSDVARRALEEANARRAAAEAAERPKEINGPSGEEPTRYGDWERKGIAVDF